MTSQQIKAFAALRQVDQITRFESVSNEQIIKAYQFTAQLRSVVVRLLQNISVGKGAAAIVSERGMGKSHMLAFTRAIANEPSLINLLDDPEASAALQELMLQKFPAEGAPTLTIGFDPDKGLNFVRAFPRAQGFEGELPATFSSEHLDELIEERISNSRHFVLFIDGLSPLLKKPETSAALMEWLKYLATAANNGLFCLVVALDQEIAEGEDAISEDIRTLFQLERISISSLAAFIGQTIFSKTQQQMKSLESLYNDLRSRMPHFTGTLTDFTQLYPIHPVVLDVAPAMRRYARSFSLFGFITAVASRAMMRRAFSLICLDDMFESFEFDLRKNPSLRDIFSIYDHLFNSVVPNLPQQHWLHAKMMLKGLLLLSLAGRASTAAEIADSVMLYDEREPKPFRKAAAMIMDRLAAASSGITAQADGREQRYFFQAPTEAIRQEDIYTELQVSSDTKLIRPREATKQSRPMTETVIGGRALTESEMERPEELSPKTLSPEISVSTAVSTSLSESHTKLTQIGEIAKAVDDRDTRLHQTLVSTGKKHFKDWPLLYDSEGLFRNRAEINIKWRGSLRKGIIKLGGDSEIHSMSGKSLDDPRPICEHDWQITVLPFDAPDELPAVIETLPTLLYWKPAPLSEQELLALKHLLAARTAGIHIFDAEQVKTVTATCEAEAADIFARVYMQQGKLLLSDGGEAAINYQSSSLINTVLTKLLDEPLSRRYPQHPKFEDLLDPDYVNEMAGWMFDPERKPTPDQQMYLEQFARPLQLVRFERGKYKLDTRDKKFPEDSPAGQLVDALEKTDAGPLSKPGAYQIVRREPFGLQRPALLLMLAALAADKRVILIDEFGSPIHNDRGLAPDTDFSDFSAVCSPHGAQSQELSWKVKVKRDASSPSHTTYPDHTILIVDDDPDIHLVLEQATIPLGCRVEKALDGVEALSKLESKPVNLIISDLRMPNMTGIELFFNIKANPALNNIPFIVLTSIDIDEEAAMALESGVEDYWIKPFRVHEVTARIRRIFSRRLTPTAAYALAAWPDERPPQKQQDIDKVPKVGELVPPDEAEEASALKIDSTSGQPKKILPSTAVSRLSVEKSGRQSGENPSMKNKKTSKQSQQPPPPPSPAIDPAEPDVLVSEKEDEDELIIPSVRANLHGASEPLMKFELEDSGQLYDRDQQAISREDKVLFKITLVNPESTPIDIMLLYNQYWDSCRRVGNAVSTPEYEEFKSLLISKAKKLQKQFNCNEFTYTVEIEGGAAHVDCEVNCMDEYLKKQPKFRLF